MSTDDVPALMCHEFCLARQHAHLVVGVLSMCCVTATLFPISLSPEASRRKLNSRNCLTDGGHIIFQGWRFVKSWRAVDSKPAVVDSKPRQLIVLRHLDQGGIGRESDAELLRRFISQAGLFRLLHALRYSPASVLMPFGAIMQQTSTVLLLACLATVYRVERPAWL